jgi:hypothetical protein
MAQMYVSQKVEYLCSSVGILAATGIHDKEQDIGEIILI